MKIQPGVQNRSILDLSVPNFAQNATNMSFGKQPHSVRNGPSAQYSYLVNKKNSIGLRNNAYSLST